MPPPIRNPYLLCINVKFYRDAQGRLYLEELWHKDLLEHTRYLKNLTVAAPCQTNDLPAHTIPWHSPEHPVRFVELPSATSMLTALFRLPAMAARLWREIGRAEIVHVGIAGWPIPFG